MKNLKGYSQLFESTQELTQEQKDWLDKCVKRSWSVNPKTGLVDVDGSFNCSDQGLTDFKGVRFGSVSEYFYCNGNNLTSLEGAPHSVGESFNCSWNDLTSLKGLPEGFSARNFYCHHNKLTSLKGLPEGFSARNFYCHHNKLTSLKGLPEGFSVGESFNCSWNDLTSLEGLPQGFSVLGFDCSHNDLTSLEGLPKGFSVGESFNCSENNLTSLEGLPQGFSVDRDFDCSDNNLTSLEGAPLSVGGKMYFFDNPISEKSISSIIKRMSDEKITLEQAVSDLWEEMPEEDQIYLAKHHPDITPEEKRIYRAMELNMKRG